MRKLNNPLRDVKTILTFFESERNMQLEEENISEAVFKFWNRCNQCFKNLNFSSMSNNIKQISLTHRANFSSRLHTFAINFSRHIGLNLFQSVEILQSYLNIDFFLLLLPNDGDLKMFMSYRTWRNNHFDNNHKKMFLWTLQNPFIGLVKRKNNEVSFVRQDLRHI